MQVALFILIFQLLVFYQRQCFLISSLRITLFVRSSNLKMLFVSFAGVTLSLGDEVMFKKLR